MIKNFALNNLRYFTDAIPESIIPLVIIPHSLLSQYFIFIGIGNETKCIKNQGMCCI